jgi:hypothetical protein
MLKRLLWSKPSAITRYVLAIVSVASAALLAEVLESFWVPLPLYPYLPARLQKAINQALGQVGVF